MSNEHDAYYMNLALAEATKAAETGDVPVGAVLVDERTDTVIATGHNTREAMHTVLGHAELNVIACACAFLGTHRLENCTLYVTLEPCPMCAGAILQARIRRVVFGAFDPVAGAMGSVWALHSHPAKNTHTTVEYGCMENECRDILRDFFKKQRKKVKRSEKVM